MRKLADHARQISAALLTAPRHRKRLLVASIDALVVVLAVWLSFSVRLGYWQLLTPPVLTFIIFEMVCAITVFVVAGVYANVFRFPGPRGLGQLAVACACIMAITIVVFGFISVKDVPRTLSVLFPVLFFLLVALSRILARYVLVDLLGESATRQRVMIYGAGAAGRQLASSLAHESRYRLVGYIDDALDLSGQRLDGVPIVSAELLEDVIDQLSPSIVFLAMPGLSRAARRGIFERLDATGTHVQTLPAISEIVDGRVSISDMREIVLSDLLAREAVQPDPALLAKAIAGRTVMVTGAGGSIGSELCRQIIRQRPRRLILFEMTEAALFVIDNEVRLMCSDLGLSIEIAPELGSLADAATIYRTMEFWRPDTVFHAAAYKHVPLVEGNVISGVRNNVFGTLDCAIAAQSLGVDRFILVSTDKAVRPTNVMGASKRVCELILQALALRRGTGTCYSMVRFGNVLGSSGSVVPYFERQIANGGPVTLTDREVTRFFMTIPEAAELVIQAGAMAKGGEVYLLDMGEPVKIYDLAKTMIRLAGRSLRTPGNPDGDIEIVEVGLRPGEKLHEELLIGEASQPTAHERIRSAQEEHIEWGQLEPALEELKFLVDEGRSDAVRKLLAKLVPGYEVPPSIVSWPNEARATGERIVAGGVRGPVKRGSSAATRPEPAT